VSNQHYRQCLVELERTLSVRIKSAVADGGRQVADSARDSGDAGQADETANEDFAEAERDSATLKQVRLALARLDDGTFGKCIVDGAAIDTKRLDAMPWTPYCLKHEQLLERASPSKMPTL
jgi:DnaK suppressor protein